MSQATTSEAARKNFSALLDRATKGETTVITRHGRPVAAVGPIESNAARVARGPALLSLRGSGKGLWGKDPAAMIARGRNERR